MSGTQLFLALFVTVVMYCMNELDCVDSAPKVALDYDQEYDLPTDQNVSLKYPNYDQNGSEWREYQDDTTLNPFSSESSTAEDDSEWTIQSILLVLIMIFVCLLAGLCICHYYILSPEEPKTKKDNITKSKETQGTSNWSSSPRKSISSDGVRLQAILSKTVADSTKQVV